ncbi:MAG: hypothetical protein EBR82_79895 [Caulobacteraceae bacterium]|nr:hypothetical protein [Caulobacteraceae bacterium]
MEVNLLTGKVGEQALVAQAVSKMNFWETYFKLLSLRKNFKFGDRALETISYIMSKDPTKNFFAKPHSVDIMMDLRMKAPRLTQVKKELMSLNLIDNYGFLSDKLIKFHTFVINQENVQFIFSFHINSYASK